MHDRDLAIQQIRKALKRRSGKPWSVTGGRGTAWGWITIHAPPARRIADNLSDGDSVELGKLLALDAPAHHQGVSIPSGGAYREEYIARAEGREPERRGEPYWD